MFSVWVIGQNTTRNQPISETEWNELCVDSMPDLSGKLFVGVKYGQDGANVALSIAVRTVDERIFC